MPRCPCSPCAARRFQRSCGAIVAGFLTGTFLCGAIEVARVLTGAAS